VMFDAVPAFFSVEASAKPVFELVNGQQEITKNTLSIQARFINDEMEDVHITTNLGYENLLVNNQTATLDYFPSDPDPASIAFYIENEIGTADALLTVDYVASQAPSVIFGNAYSQDGKTILDWAGAVGADEMDFYEYNLSNETLGVIIESGIEATLEDATYDGIEMELNPGWYMMIFSNQYGETEELVYLSNSTSENCIPNSDIPCTQ